MLNLLRFREVAFVDLKVGHFYLVATSQTGEAIMIGSNEPAIGDICLDPVKADSRLESNEFVIAAAKALRSGRNFAGILDKMPYPYQMIKAPVIVIHQQSGPQDGSKRKNQARK